MERKSAKKIRFPEFRDKFMELQGSMTDVEFGKKLGISRQTVGFYRNGDRIPDALGLRDIAQKCDVSADYLLGLTECPAVDDKAKATCEYTGLSTLAANSLRDTLNPNEHTKEFIEIADNVVECDLPTLTEQLEKLDATTRKIHELIMYFSSGSKPDDIGTMADNIALSHLDPDVYKQLFCYGESDKNGIENIDAKTLHKIYLNTNLDRIKSISSSVNELEQELLFSKIKLIDTLDAMLVIYGNYNNARTEVSLLQMALATAEARINNLITQSFVDTKNHIGDATNMI